MKVIVISSKYPPEYSGSGGRAHNTYLRLREKYDVKFRVITSSEIYKESSKYQIDSVDVKRISSKSWNGIKGANEDNLLTRFRSILVRRGRYIREFVPVFLNLLRNKRETDVLHVFGNVTVTQAAIAFAKVFNVPIIIELTSDRATPFFAEPRVVTWFWGHGLPKNSKIVCISERLRRMCESFGVSENVWSRPNPIDVSRFRLRHSEKHVLKSNNTKFTEASILICFIGKIIPSKNQKLLVEILKFLPERYVLFLGGPLETEGVNAFRDVKYFKELKDMVRVNRLAKRVQIKPSFIHNPEDYIGMSDVYVSASKSEGLGTTILEAFCCGVPVVALRIDGITDQFISNNINGYEVTENPREFADSIQLACKIPSDNLMKFRQNLVEELSTSKIDAKYVSLLAGKTD